MNYAGVRYITNQEDYKKFDTNLATNSISTFNRDLKKIENWVRENRMHFNENKSKVLLVTTKTSGDNGTLNIYLNKKRLEQVSEIKYLGIYFDSRFSFDRHTECPRRNVQYFGRVFLMLNYTDITQNTYIQS